MRKNEPVGYPTGSFCYLIKLHMWQGLDKVINEYLDNVTIADLMKSGAAGDNYVI